MPCKDLRQRRLYNAAYCKTNKATNQHNGKEYRLLSRYGINANEYDRMFIEQDGLCAICKNPDKINLAVDHNHTTNQVRSLICLHCNIIVGIIETHTNTLTNAGNYVKHHTSVSEGSINPSVESRSDKTRIGSVFDVRDCGTGIWMGNVCHEI